MPVLYRVEEIKYSLFQEHGLKGGLRSPAHITLHRPFAWKEEKEAELVKKLNNFKGGESFKIFLKNFDFFEPRVIYVNVLPNQNLQTLYNQLKLFAKRELKLINEWEDLRGFHPHVTIANRDLKKPKFYELQKRFEQGSFEGDFDCNSIHLLRLEKTWEVIHTVELK